MSRVIHVVGAPAAGKSLLVRALAPTLALPAFSIDDERLRLMGPDDVWPEDDRFAWARLRQAVSLHLACIVETSGLSPRDRVLLAGHDVFRILVRTERSARLARLRARVRRGDPMARTEDYVIRVARLGEPVLPADAIWRGDGPASIAPLVERVRAWLEPASVAV